jgi:hypothetical protein
MRARNLARAAPEIQRDVTCGWVLCACPAGIKYSYFSLDGIPNRRIILAVLLNESLVAKSAARRRNDAAMARRKAPRFGNNTRYDSMTR